jgi:hypothetical protein
MGASAVFGSSQAAMTRRLRILSNSGTTASKVEGVSPASMAASGAVQDEAVGDEDEVIPSDLMWARIQEVLPHEDLAPAKDMPMSGPER